MSVKSILTQKQGKSLSGQDILECTNDDIKIMKYSELNKYDNIDDVFGNKNSIALLFETQPAYGHWTLLMRHPGKVIEFFDSYGHDSDIDVTKRIKDKLWLHGSGQDTSILSKLILNSDYDYVYNKTPLQNKDSDIATCGRWIIIRHMIKELGLPKFIKLIKSIGKSPDETITYLTGFV